MKDVILVALPPYAVNRTLLVEKIWLSVTLCAWMINHHDVLCSWLICASEYYKTLDWIMMQQDTDREYHHASTLLKDTGTCLFNLSHHGSRLQPFSFASRSCTDFKHIYHSFGSETACGQCSIGGNFPFLYGVYFWWIYDCSAVNNYYSTNRQYPLSVAWRRNF